MKNHFGSTLVLMSAVAGATAQITANVIQPNINMPQGAMLGMGLRAKSLRADLPAEGSGEVLNKIIYRPMIGDAGPYPGSDMLGVGYSLVHGNPAGDPVTRKLLE